RCSSAVQKAAVVKQGRPVVTREWVGGAGGKEGVTRGQGAETESLSGLIIADNRRTNFKNSKQNELGRVHNGNHTRTERASDNRTERMFDRVPTLGRGTRPRQVKQLRAHMHPSRCNIRHCCSRHLLKLANTARLLGECAGGRYVVLQACCH
ncbi:unnamed protein product, partial [Ectocarpus sp. 4 AP-2014]